uniref:Uncharacterized protein n=1 Tax=Neogobius melanostomus TaxID=47308 RepID=A0A8C6V3T4_9GOBI
VAPLPVVHLLVAGLELGLPRPHVYEQVQIPVEQLHGKVIGLQLPPRLLLFGALRRAPVAEQEQAAGLGGAEVEGYGARFLGVPLGERDVGLRGLEGDRVQGGHVFAAEHQVSVQGDLRVALDG